MTTLRSGLAGHEALHGPDMIEMAVGQEDFAGRQALLLKQRGDGRRVGAVIDDDRVVRFVGRDVAVCANGTDADGIRPSYDLPPCHYGMISSFQQNGHRTVVLQLHQHMGGELPVCTDKTPSRRSASTYSR